jgi:hypothetical protein
MTMYGNVNTPFGRGFTYFRGEVPESTEWKQSTAIEGIVGEFKDVTPKEGVLQHITRSPSPQKCRVVRNAATIRLKPGRACVWQAGHRNKRVNGYQHVQTGEIAGIVDEHLPAAGVPVGDLFWLVQGGQVLATAKASVDIAVGANLQAATGTSSLNDDAGRVEATAVTDADTDATFAAESNMCGRAVSSIATDTTSRRILANLTIVG